MLEEFLRSVMPWKRKILPVTQLPFGANLSNLVGKMAIPARFERATFRLGGGPSILLRYGTVCSKVLIFQGFRGIGDCSPWGLQGIFANQEGRFLISFSNFGGRTFSHLLILTSGSGAADWLQFGSESAAGPFSASRKGGSRPFS